VVSFTSPPIPRNARNAPEIHGFCAAEPMVRIHLPPAESRTNVDTGEVPFRGQVTSESLPSSEQSCELRYGPRRPACDPYAPYGRFPKRRSCRSTQEGAVAHKCRDGRDHHGRNRRHLPPAELGESRRRDGPWARFCESAEQPDKRGSACRPRRLTGSRACEKPAENPAGKGEKGDKKRGVDGPVSALACSSAQSRNAPPSSSIGNGSAPGPCRARPYNL